MRGAPSDRKMQQVQWGSIPLFHLPVSDGVLKLLTRATSLGNSVQQGDSCSKLGSRKGQFTSIHVNVETHPPRQSPLRAGLTVRSTHTVFGYLFRGGVSTGFMTLKPGYCKVNRKTFKKHHTYTKHSEGDTYIYIATLAAFQSHQGKELTQVFLKKKKQKQKTQNQKPP